jgi:hypothetical protein
LRAVMRSTEGIMLAAALEHRRGVTTLSKILQASSFCATLNGDEDVWSLRRDEGGRSVSPLEAGRLPAVVQGVPQGVRRGLFAADARPPPRAAPIHATGLHRVGTCP